MCADNDCPWRVNFIYNKGTAIKLKIALLRTMCDESIR